MEDVFGLQTFCSLSDDEPPGLCLRTQHGVDVGLRGELEKVLPRLGEPVAVPLDEGRSVVVALVGHVVYLFVFYPQDARVVLRHRVAVNPYVFPIRMLLVPQTYVLPGSDELSFPQGFSLQVGLDEFFHLARDVEVHLPGIFQNLFHVVVDVVPRNAHHDLRNFLRLYEVFPAYSTHVEDDTRGQQRGKVQIVLVHGHLRDVLGGSFPGCFQGFEVTLEAFLFIDVDCKLSNVVRQGVCVRDDA